MAILAGKRALITGIASSRSIAWGIAQAMHKQGASLAFSYQTERLKERVDDAAAEFGGGPVIPCDVANEGDIERMFARLSEHWDSIDVVVHAIAFAPREQLQGRFVDAVTRDGFKIAHEISSYSFAAMAKASRPLMQSRQGALLTLSYLGAVRALPSYNVMGLAKASLEASVRFLAQDLGPEGTRVNAISAGPIKTLAAAGVGNLRKMLDHVEKTSPIRRNVTIEDVGNAAAFLCSDLAAGVTGEVLYVDGGYSHVSMGELVG